jgi:hypothetical protein
MGGADAPARHPTSPHLYPARRRGSLRTTNPDPALTVKCALGISRKVRRCLRPVRPVQSGIPASARVHTVRTVRTVRTAHVDLALDGA